VPNIISFVGSYLKAERVHKHVGELETWVEEFIKNNLHKAGINFDSQSVPEGRFLSFLPTDAPYPWMGPIIGDIVHNLRAALDLVACAIVRAHSVDVSKLCFPMNDTRKSLVNSRDYRAIEAVEPDLALIIADTIKPYKTGGEAAFWALNQLDRMDKHRTLIPAISETKITVRCIDKAKPVMEFGPGTLIIWPGGDLPDPGTWAHAHNERYAEPALEICFDQGEPFSHQPMIPTMHRLCELVLDTINVLQKATRGAAGRLG
jgi:hypothetical protein